MYPLINVTFFFEDPYGKGFSQLHSKIWLNWQNEKLTYLRPVSPPSLMELHMVETFSNYVTIQCVQQRVHTHLHDVDESGNKGHSLIEILHVNNLF